MTEALRPAGRRFAGRPLPDLPSADVREAIRAAGARPAVRAAGARAAAGVKRPYHLGVLLGVSAGAYAASLAGVTFLQASSEAATAAVRAPAVDAVARMAAGNDRLEQAIASVRERLAASGGDYEAAAAALADLEAQLDSLTTTVAAIEGQSLRLPTRIALPGAPRPAAASKPRTVATTGASGG